MSNSLTGSVVGEVSKSLSDIFRTMRTCHVVNSSIIYNVGNQLIANLHLYAENFMLHVLSE